MSKLTRDKFVTECKKRGYSVNTIAKIVYVEASQKEDHFLSQAKSVGFTIKTKKPKTK